MTDYEYELGYCGLPISENNYKQGNIGLKELSRRDIILARTEKLSDLEEYVGFCTVVTSVCITHQQWCNTQFGGEEYMLLDFSGTTVSLKCES